MKQKLFVTALSSLAITLFFSACSDGSPVVEQEPEIEAVPMVAEAEPIPSQDPAPIVPPIAESTDSKVADARQPEHGSVHVFDLGEGVSLEMIYLHGGSFRMGSENGDPDELPMRTVTLDGFWIGKYPVTQAQFNALVRDFSQLATEIRPSFFTGPDLPVDQISWMGTQVFLEKLSEKTGQSFRLPTEAEWEYACRAGTTTDYFFGDDPAMLGDFAWYFGNSEERTHPVGQKKPNPWGLYDMLGNVLEWCSDWYAPYPEVDETNPTGPDTGEVRVMRGGSWNFFPQYNRSAFRYYGLPTYPIGNILGFRLVLSEID